MKNTLLLIICSLAGTNAFCQAGINTGTPQQVVHIAGTPSASTAIGTTGKFVVTPTMRVEGLNQTNNSTHPAAPAISTQPVYATASGDLVIGNRVQLIKQTLPGTDVIPTPLTLNVPSGTAGITSTIYTQSFTLKQPSMVYFMANISFNFTGSGGTLIASGGTKMGGIEFSFSSVPASSGIPTSGYFAASQYPYTQDPFSDTGLYGTNLVPNGNFQFALNKALKLPPGSYTFNIIACASAGTGTGFSSRVGISPTDYINITAIAL